jgi:hypothetical protein
MDLNIEPQQVEEGFEAITSGWVDPEPEENWGPYFWADTEEEMIEAINSERSSQDSLFTNPLDFDGDRMKPSFLADQLGQNLLTPGLIHTFYGPSGSKKSFIAMTAVLEAGGFYIDLEMGLGLMSKRLKQMGYPYSQSNGFTSISSKEEFENTINVLMAFYQPTVVVIDSFTQLATVLGKDSNNGEDTGLIYQKYLRPLAARGFTVVTTDHSPKSGSANDHPIGSQNKKAQLDVAYRIHVNDVSGYSEMYLEKDRMYLIQSRLPENSNLVGEVRLTSQPLRVKIIPNGMMEQMHQIPGYSRSDYTIMDRQISALMKNSPMSISDLDGVVTGKSILKTKCRKLLIENGYIDEEQIAVDGKKPKKVLKLSTKKWVFTTLD